MVSPDGSAAGAPSEPTDRPESALLRWRLVLGPERGGGGGAGACGQELGAADARIAADQRLSAIDRSLDFLYGEPDRGANLASSVPYVPTWLGDIRRYFPRDVVTFLQQEAVNRRGLTQLLL